MAVGLIGIPFDENSSFLKGSALAPDRIRQALHSDSSNLFAEDLLDLKDENHLKDLGNLDTGNGYLHITNQVSEVYKEHPQIISLGGDHSITYPIIKAISLLTKEFTILQIDAHPDLYNAFQENRFSHACQFARILEEKLVKDLVQCGIRTLNPQQLTQAKKFGVEIIDMKAWRMGKRPMVEAPVYISLDLDGLDPAYASAVSHPEPGGLTTSEVVEIIQSIPGPVIGADIVEFNPTIGQVDLTARVAAKLVKEIASKMLSTLP